MSPNDHNSITGLLAVFLAMQQLPYNPEKLQDIAGK